MTATESPRQADFSLEADQESVRDTFSAFFSRESPVSLVRECESSGFDSDLWAKLSDLRVIAMAVPTAQGGDGAGWVDLVLLTEQWGRTLAPIPLAESIVATRAVAAGGADVPGELLESAIAGKRLLTFAHHPAVPGKPQLVQAGAVADAVVALVEDHLVLASSESELAIVRNQGRTPMAGWEIGGPETDSVVLASGARARELFSAAKREWRLLMAGALVGMTKGALDIALAHARDRVAFGVPIGSFQAVAHPLVDVAMDLEMARRITWKAAWWADRDPACEHQLIPMAYLFAEEAAVRSATVGVHTLGGVGFTVEADEQLFFRRAKGWTLMAGDPLAELDAIADVVLGPKPDNGALSGVPA